MDYKSTFFYVHDTVTHNSFFEEMEAGFQLLHYLQQTGKQDT